MDEQRPDDVTGEAGEDREHRVQDGADALGGEDREDRVQDGADALGGEPEREHDDPVDDESEHEELEHDEVEHDEAEEEEGLEAISVEISGLSLYTHHGVTKAEREVGQRLVLDLRLELGEVDATTTDRIEDTVDYAEVCQLVTLVAQQRSHRTLERLCSRIADRLLADYELDGVWVKIAKPEPPIPLPVDEVSVEIWREAGE